MTARKKFHLENVHLRRQRPVKQIENEDDYPGINYHYSANRFHKNKTLELLILPVLRGQTWMREREGLIKVDGNILQGTF